MSESEVPVPAESPPAVEAPAPVETPEPKKKGRPVGAKDTTKRTRKPVQIRVEPLPEKPADPAPTPKPEPVEPRKFAEVPVEIEEPKTPRTLIKETSRHLMNLRALVNDNRKDEMGKRYIQKWSKWPLV